MSDFGPTYDPAIDGDRLHRQQERIKDYALSHGWLTLGELSSMLDYPEASISAQLRHLRKPKFGSYIVEKRRRILNGRPTGLWEYRVSSPIFTVQSSGQMVFA